MYEYIMLPVFLTEMNVDGVRFVTADLSGVNALTADGYEVYAVLLGTDEYTNIFYLRKAHKAEAKTSK